MKVCALCGSETDVGREISRRDTCRNCGGDLHICLNCRFYSETAHNNCIEVKAEYQRQRDKSNFCDYFQYREGGAKAGGSADAKADAMRKLDDLFGKN